MQRRSALEILGVVALSGLSGCLGDDLSGGEDSGDGETIEYTVSSTVTIDDGGTSLSFDVSQEGETVTESKTVEFVFRVTNEGSNLLEIGSGAPPPFGIVAFESETESERAIFPWSDQYRASDHVDTDGQDVVGAEDIGLKTEIEPGETIEQPYTLSAETPRLGPGEYTFDQRYDVGEARDEPTDTQVIVGGTVEIENQGTPS